MDKWIFCICHLFQIYRWSKFKKCFALLWFNSIQKGCNETKTTTKRTNERTQFYNIVLVYIFLRINFYTRFLSRHWKIAFPPDYPMIMICKIMLEILQIVFIELTYFLIRHIWVAQNGMDFKWKNMERTHLPIFKPFYFSSSPLHLFGYFDEILLNFNWFIPLPNPIWYISNICDYHNI